MKKILKRIAALFLVALVGVSSVACSLDGLEQPEWLEQALCDHVFDEEEILKEPTCAEKGKKEEICSDCGKTRITTIRATGEHIYDDEGLTSPTPWNERVTAGGANVLDGSIAQIKKVVGASVKSKNLIPYPYEVLENVYAGLTYNANADGSILLEGKSSNAISINLANIELSPNTYYFKNGRTNEGVYAFIRRANGTMISYDNSFVVEEKETVTFSVYTGYENEVNYTIYPMLSTENIAWQPYFGEKHASFAGIKSTGANGEESVFEFPKTEVPSGAEIDFDRQVIVGADGTETPFTDSMKIAGRQYTVWNGGTETVLGNDGAEYGAITTITIDYVFVCTVCGKASGEIVPEEEMVECSSHTYLATGHCSTCDAFILDRNINYTETSGELAYGWYRVSEASLPSIELVGDFEVLSAEYEVDITTFKLSNFEFDDSYIFVSYPSLNLFFGCTCKYGRYPCVFA